MAAEWAEAMLGSFLARVASLNGCDLSVIGGEGSWFWLVSRKDDDYILAEGEEPDLTAAMAIAENAARRLADDIGAA
jgi:hypothetical protein